MVVFCDKMVPTSESRTHLRGAVVSGVAGAVATGDFPSCAVEGAANRAGGSEPKSRDVVLTPYFLKVFCQRRVCACPGFFVVVSFFIAKRMFGIIPRVISTQHLGSVLCLLLLSSR